MPGIFKNRIFAGKQKPFDAIHHLCTVKFLDNSEAISFTFERNTKGCFLVDHVCSSINLIEKDYFGLKYTDAEKQECWLDPEKTIYSQIKGLSNPVLYFQVRFYPSDLDSIKEEITRYQLFLQVRKDFNEQRLICSLQDALLLTAYVVQEELGDYNQLEDWNDHFSKIKLPSNMLEYESYIGVLHQQLKGLSQSGAEYKFLKKAASLNSYGIDPYVVSDKEGYQMYLTVAPKGLIIFEENLPTRTYHWRNVGKLSFDGKSFHIKLDDREKRSGGRLFNKKLQQQTTVTYKCLSHTNCKQLWKNAMAYKYFYTLQSSSEAPKVLSSGGFFSRGSKFRYSGSCLAEIRRSSASINREEPRVTRHLSNVQIDEDSRYSTLPKKWKPDSSFAEDSCDTKPTLSEVRVNESSNEKEQFIRRTSSESALGNTPVKMDLKIASFLHENDTLESKGECTKEVEEAKESQFIECFISPEQNFRLIPSFKNDVSMETIPSAWNNTAKEEDGTSEKVDDSNHCDDAGDVDGRDVGRVDDDVAEYSPHASEATNVSSSSEVTSTTACSWVDSVASSVDDNLKDAWKSTELTSNLPTIDPKIHPDLSGDLSINSSRDESTEVPSEENIFHESLIQPRIGVKAIKRKRQESGSGYDTGYMSSGSERLSRSFESEDHALDFTALKNNGILEEMEFPTSDSAVLGDGERIEEHEISSDCTESQDQPLNDRKPDIREELLSMLSYGSEDVSSFIKNASTDEEKLKHEFEAKDGIGCDENADLTPTSSFPTGDFSSTTSSSYPSFFESFPEVAADKSSEPPCLPSLPPSSVGFFTSFGSGHSLTSGVFSSDNFRRIKEIEQMIEDNKNKIQLMKQTISSEMKRSRRTNPAEPCQSHEISPVHADDSAYLKQPKHVSFSSHRTEWYHGERDQPHGNLRSWTGMEAINTNNDHVSSDNYKPVVRTEEIVELIVPRIEESNMESSGEFPNDAGTSEFVKKFPSVSSDGTFVTQVELCKCSDDGVLDEDDSNNCTKEDAGCHDNSNEDHFLGGIPASSDTTDNILTPSSGAGNSSSNISSDTSKKSPMMEKRFEQFTFSETVVEEVVKITPEVIRSLSAEFHLPTAASNLTATSVAQDVDVVTCESALNLANNQNLISSEMSTDDLVPSVEWGKECSVSKEFLTASEHSTSSSRSVMKSICKGTGLTLLSVMLSLLFFGVCLAIIFELDQDIPYVTDQETVMELRKSIYEPAREQVVKYFKK